MTRFPPTLPRRTRTLYGALGIALFFLAWWLLTLPLFTETEVRRTAVKTGETREVPDPISGETITVEVTRFQEKEVVVERAIVNPPALDTPQNTFRKAWHVGLPQHILRSSLRILLGFLVSAAVAVPLGIMMGLFPRLHATISPIVSFLRPLPSISWVPLAIIWLGAGEAQKLAIIFMGSFSAALIYTVEATVKVNPDLIRAALNLGLTQRQLLWRVLLPAALPSILSGLKVVLAICWTCVISAEIVGTQVGLGSLIWTRKEIYDTAAVLVGMACISGVVLILDALFVRIERRLVPYMFVKEEEE